MYMKGDKFFDTIMFKGCFFVSGCRLRMEFDIGIQDSEEY